MAIRHSITLSTSEPNNEVGNLKIRQGDEQTQTLVANITENGVPKPFVGLQPFFCAKLGQTAGLGIIEQKVTGPMNPANGTLEYVMQPEDWQQLGRQTAYFSFRKMVNDHEWTEQFSTRDFNYNVTKSVFSEGVKETKKDGSTYVWTIEDMVRLFKEYIATGKADWEEFVEQNREVLESVDPGGKLIGELIDARKPFGGDAHSTLGERLDSEKAEVSAQLAETAKKTKGRISVEEFGAKCNANYLSGGLWYEDPAFTIPANDDIEAFKEAINYIGKNGGELFVPGRCLISEPIVIDKPGIKLTGYRNISRIVKTSTKTTSVLGNDINAVLIINARYFENDSVSLQGDIANGITGIAFSSEGRECKLSNFTISHCLKAFNEYGGCWMVELNKIHCVSCVSAFDFSNNVDKTSMTFKNCWAENCGQAYAFRNLSYSSIIDCGADYCNFTGDNNPYGNPLGNRATSKGIYDFLGCYVVNIQSIGAEYSYGNGMLRSQGSTLIVDGIRGVGILSEYQHNYTNYPSYAVGAIQIEGVRSSINLNNVSINGFENTWVTANQPTKKHAVIGYNYIYETYGLNTKKMVVASLIASILDYDIIAGHGKYNDDCLLLDQLGNVINVKDYIDVGGVRQFKALTLSHTGSTKISVPITAQVNQNERHLIKISGMNNDYNSNLPKGFYAEISFSSIGTVSNVSVLSSSTGLTATGNGASLEITLPSTYTSMRVECSAISSSMKLIDFVNTTLV